MRPVKEPLQEPDVEPVGVKLRRLRQEKGLSLENFAYEARRYGRITFSAVGQIERGQVKQPSPETLEAFAAVLGIEPSEFHEYDLAMARRLLDESVQGLAQATANLNTIRGALRDAALLPLERAAEQAAKGAKPSRRGRPPSRRKRSAG